MLRLKSSQLDFRRGRPVRPLGEPATGHNSFLVIDAESNQLVGMILRTHLLVILKQRLFLVDVEEELAKAMQYTPPKGSPSVTSTSTRTRTRPI